MGNQDFTNLKFAVRSLGCKVNQAETNSIRDYLISKGAVESGQDQPDIIIVNSCAVTVQAESRSRNLLRKLRRDNPEAEIILMGCYALIEDAAVADDNLADIILGTLNKADLYPYLQSLSQGHLNIPIVDLGESSGGRDFTELHGLPRGDRTRAQVVIQDGCENFCSFCIIPYLRGPRRSRSAEAIVREIQDLTDAGYKEVVLTGINLGNYGRERKDNYFLVNLLQDILNATAIPRIRLSSIEPECLTEDILRLYADNKRLLPHFHLPLQSGSNGILKAMNRRYTVEDYAELITSIRKALPEVAITTDYIVGFPGETAAVFAEGREFVRKAEFADMHIFRYSPRPGTAAYNMEGRVFGVEKSRRSELLRHDAEAAATQFRLSNVGKVAQVLTESPDKTGRMTGRTENYLKVVLPPDLGRNEIIAVRITHYEDGELFAEPVDEQG